MQDSKQLGIALLALCLAACGPGARRATIDPRAQPAARFVVGRVEMFRDGQAQAVTKSGLGAALNPGPLATLSLQHSGSSERFQVPIENERGWFAAQLPPGTYTVAMQYYIWVFGTPVRVQVPPQLERCYLGSVEMHLFVRASAMGAWARAAGGAIPMDDIDFAVTDQSVDAASYAGTALPHCTATLTQPVLPEIPGSSRPPSSGGGGSR